MSNNTHAVVPSGKLRGRRVSTLTDTELHRLWAAWNGNEPLRQRQFFLLILAERKRRSRGRNGSTAASRSQTKPKPKRTSHKSRYKQYLTSDDWKQLRGIILVRDNHRCVCCHLLAIDVHHRSYDDDVMTGKNLALLCSLCRRCHREIHYDNGKKIRMDRVDVKLANLQQAKALN